MITPDRSTSNESQTSSASSAPTLRSFNSAANLSSIHTITLDQNEYMFDVNTRNSCTRPFDNFARLFASSNVMREFSSFTSVNLYHNYVVDKFYKYPHLNRYNEFLVYEGSRVRAPFPGEKHNYINANWVDGFRENRKFIMTQTPLNNTVGQFWQMVFDRMSPVVVCLSRLVDDQNNPIVPKKIKESVKFNLMTIELVHIRNVCSSYDSIVLKLTKEGSQNAHECLLIVYHDWGTTSYPRRPGHVLNLIADMNFSRGIKMKEENKKTSPIVLFCDDGLGRAGAVAALDIICRRLEYSAQRGTPFADVLDTIARLRMSRAAACPRADQYIFLSMTVLEFAIRSKFLKKKDLLTLDMSNYIVHKREDE